MKFTGLFSLCVVAACSSAVPTPEDPRLLPPGAQAPRFEEYPASAERYPGPLAPPDFASLPGARMFRTAIRAGAAQGPNFAGRLTVVAWGCGTGCQQFMIVDAESGAITDGFTTQWGVRHRVDSDLLIVNPRPDDLPAGHVSRQRTSYYRWTGMGLELLATE